MANEFFTILTAAGRNKLANAVATATPLNLTQMAVGDGDPATPGGAYYSPAEVQTALKHEVWRGSINHLAVDANNPNWIVAELVIPDDVGGFHIREVGLFDGTGAMIAVGKFLESYKPTLAAGSNKQLYVRMILEVANTSAVTLLVDPSVVLATRKYCDDKVADELNKRDSKQSVRVATTAAIALAGLQTIDGVVLVAGDRVLVKDQAASTQNGIYIAAVGAWTRGMDADSGTKLNAGALVPVEAGTVNADTIWMLKTDGAIIIGATPIVFQWAGGLNTQTQEAGDNSARIANTAFVQTAIQAAITALVNSSPAALDTLKELATALGNDANFATTMTNALALKAPLASPALTGTPTGPTAAPGTNTTQLATTAFVRAAVAALSTTLAGLTDTAIAALADKHVMQYDNATGKWVNRTLAAAGIAALASPALTGTPTAPTAAGGTNSTQVATTAFVQAAVTALINSSPAALDTLNELAAALGNDPNFATTVTNALAAKATLASPALTGTPTSPTAAPGTNTTQLATTAFVAAALAALTYARLDVANSWTKGQRGAVVALSDGANIALDLSLSNNYSVTLGGNRTLDNPTNAVAGQSGVIVVTQDGAGVRLLAYGSNYKAAGGLASLPALGTAAGSVSHLYYYVETPTRIVLSVARNVS